MTITITITKATVLDDVGRLTHYEGNKSDGNGEAFERISTKETDADMLEQFWKAACESVTEAVKRFITSLTTTTNYVATLEVSSSYDTTLTASIQTNLQNCVTFNIVSQWYKLTNKSEAEDYALQAAAQLNEAMSKIFYKKKPSRKSITY